MLHDTLKLLSFKGRLSRRRYWSRFPILVAAPLVALGVCWITGMSLLAVCACVLVAATPLFSAGFRRLQDTGEHGSDAVAPWGVFLVAIVLGSWSARSFEMLQTAFATENPPDGPAGFAFVIIHGFGGGLIGLAALGFFATFLLQITPTVVQTLLPSTPGPNRYGPNPNEAPT